MIGNDVVDMDLAATQSNWKRKGFLGKVFTVSEREYILSSEEIDSTVWLLWSMKEAAYKAHQRKYQLPRKLSWQRQECIVTKLNGNTASGMVKIEGQYYDTKSLISSGLVFTSAVKDGTIPVKNAIFRSSSEEMKQNFIRDFSHYYHLPKEKISIQKNVHGVPVLTCGDRKHSCGFSFTGHGKFSAFSMALMNC